MAIIDERNETIIFDDGEKDAAWKNAPTLINLDQNKFRLCYLCKFAMEKRLTLEKTNIANESLGWIVSLVNTKKVDFSFDNLVAIHFGCLEARKKANQTKTLQKVHSLIWRYNEED